MHSQAKVDTYNESRGPLLLISGLEDHTVPDVVTRSTLKQYRDSTAVTDLNSSRVTVTPCRTAGGGKSPTQRWTG